jgi:hypothetical protein
MFKHVTAASMESVNRKDKWTCCAVAPSVKMPNLADKFKFKTKIPDLLHQQSINLFYYNEGIG